MGSPVSVQYISYSGWHVVSEGGPVFILIKLGGVILLCVIILYNTWTVRCRCRRCYFIVLFNMGDIEFWKWCHNYCICGKPCNNHRKTVGCRRRHLAYHLYHLPLYHLYHPLWLDVHNYWKGEYNRMNIKFQQLFLLFILLQPLVLYHQ